MKFSLTAFGYKKAALILVGLVVIGFGAKESFDVYAESKEEKQLEVLYAELTALCLGNEPEASLLIGDIIRSCVHKNSTHNMDDDFYKDWKNKPVMTQAVIDYIEGRRDKKKSYECSTRSDLMVGLLTASGVKVRSVITAEFRPAFNDHVIVEVWNEKLNDWEAQDPSHDIVFKENDSGERLSLQEMVTLGTENFKPCLPDGSCGWNLKSDEGFDFETIKHYWGVMVVKAESNEWQVVYNPDHFDPQKPLEGQAYCQKREKFCRLPPLASDELKVQAKRL